MCCVLCVGVGVGKWLWVLGGLVLKSAKQLLLLRFCVHFTLGGTAENKTRGPGTLTRTGTRTQGPGPGTRHILCCVAGWGEVQRKIKKSLFG